MASLEPWQWGQAFKLLLKVKGVEGGGGRNQGKHSDTVSECCKYLGVDNRTARERMKAGDIADTLQNPEKTAPN